MHGTWFFDIETSGVYFTLIIGQIPVPSPNSLILSAASAAGQQQSSAAQLEVACNMQ